MSIWKVIAGPIIEGIDGILQRRHEVKLKKHEARLKEIEARMNLRISAQEHLHAWELMSISNSGWKDEYITILFTLPFVGVFLPWTQDYVSLGFEYISKTPFWYQMVLLAVIGSALGVRLWKDFREPIVKAKAAEKALIGKPNGGVNE